MADDGFAGLSEVEGVAEVAAARPPLEEPLHFDVVGGSRPGDTMRRSPRRGRIRKGPGWESGSARRVLSRFREQRK